MSRKILCKKLHQMSKDLFPAFSLNLTPQAMTTLSVITGDDGVRRIVLPSQVCDDAVEQIEKDHILAMKYKFLLDGLKKNGMDPLYQFIMHETIEEGYEFLKTREEV